MIIQLPDKKLPIELPFQKIQRFCEDYKLPWESAVILAEDLDLCSYFEQALKKTKSALTLCKWLINEVLARLNAEKLNIQFSPVSSEHIAELVNQIENKTLSSKMAKDIFAKMWETSKGVQELISELNLKRMDDPEQIKSLVDQVIQSFPQQCEQYKQGKTTVYKFLMGQIMKLSKGQADPVSAGKLLKEKLNQ